MKENIREQGLLTCDRCGKSLEPGERVILAFGGVFCFACRHGAIDERLEDREDCCSLCGERAAYTFRDGERVVCDDCRSAFLLEREKILGNRLRKR